MLNADVAIEELLAFTWDDIHQSIGSRFLKVAEKVPEKIALKSDTGTLSYQLLAIRARCLAKTLRQYDFTTGTTVVIGLRKPEDIVSAILGVLLAGYIYVPIEIDFPAKKMEFVINDSEAKLIIIEQRDEKIVAPLLNSAKTQIVFLENAYKTDPIEIKEINNDPFSHASLLYTSGSTGNPKGVLQIHRNILFYVYTLTKLYSITAEDKHSVLSSFIFDGSTTDMYCALLNGAALIPINIRNVGIKGLADSLHKHAVTLYHSTPTTYRELLGQKDIKNRLAAIRLVLLGGEVVTYRDFLLFQKYFSADCLFVNGYGATETSGFIALNTVSHNTQLVEDSNVVFPVGKEPKGIEIFFRNDKGEMTESEGELYVRSQYIGLGYWKNAELTKKSYQVDAAQPEIRIFRTGDIAKRNQDGAITLLGRQDRQLKIRGYRIEASEIETTAMEFLPIRQAVVKTYHDERTHSEELALFVTLNPDHALSETAIRLALAKQLPRYMVPTYIEIRDSFPLTDTNKINIKLLTVKKRIISTVENFINKNQKLEDIVFDVWRQTLGISQFDKHDNFFDLGGNSLLMAQAHARLEERLSSSILLFHLFENPTVNSLTQYLETRTKTYDFSEIYTRMEKRQQTHCR